MFSPAKWTSLRLWRQIQPPVNDWRRACRPSARDNRASIQPAARAVDGSMGSPRRGLRGARTGRRGPHHAAPPVGPGLSGRVPGSVPGAKPSTQGEPLRTRPRVLPRGHGARAITPRGRQTCRSRAAPAKATTSASTSPVPTVSNVHGSCSDGAASRGAPLLPLTSQAVANSRDRRLSPGRARAHVRRLQRQSLSYFWNLG